MECQGIPVAVTFNEKTDLRVTPDQAVKSTAESIEENLANGKKEEGRILPEAENLPCVSRMRMEKFHYQPMWTICAPCNFLRFRGRIKIVSEDSRIYW
ncbi:hypothetical protein D3Z36_07325 [Lachnospiraceae bacterium]|nr:hypothetical protein [Lachnospiraceae bacterium]